MARAYRYTKRGLARAELVRDFARRFVVHKKDRWAGQPFELEPWQWNHIIKPIYGRVDRTGKRRVRRALIGLPRWQGKSETVSLMVMYHLFVDRVHEGEAYVVASNERQANIVFNTTKRMIQANPRLAAACDIYKREIWVKETGCIFKALPADADAAQGFHPSFTAVDEVHVHRSHDLIEAMVSGMAAREEPLLVAITTAGPRRSGPLWEMLHGGNDYPAWGRDLSSYVYWIGAKDDEDPTDPKVWRRANPASWITDAMLAEQFAALPLWSFERYHLNRFPQAEGSIQAFGHDMVAKNLGAPDIDPKKACIIGVDAAPRRDRCSIMVVQRDASGLHHWQPFVFEPGRQMEYDDFETIEEQVRQLCQTLYVSRIVSDPAFVWLALNRLRNEGYPVETMTQDNAHMCPVAENLHRLLSGSRMRIAPDPRVVSDLENAAVYERPPWGWRMGKLDDGLHIDSAIAGGMASFVLESEEQTPSFADTGGIHTIRL